MSYSCNIIITGVGGQGTVLSGRIISLAAEAAGYDVKVSEVHGMSQRGGSVITQVRFGDSVAAPIIAYGKADIVLAFEKLEALRIMPYLSPNGKLIVNNRALLPMPVITGVMKYPDDIEQQIFAVHKDAEIFDALALAEEAGNAKALNIVLLGRLSKYFDWPQSFWTNAITAAVKPKFIDLNLEAFAMGRESK